MEPISRIDPSINQLYFRGFNATYLAGTLDFESVLYLLVHDSLPDADQRVELEQRMIELRGLYKEEIQSLDILVQSLDDIRDEHELCLFDTLLAFVTLCPLVIANQFTEIQGRKAEDPHNDFGLAANFLWMVQGRKPKETDLADFQTCLILHMDDPDNPSLTALLHTLDEGSASEALHAALSKHVGSLHHGAGTLAMSMFEEINKAEDAPSVLRKRLESNEKIYGMGHRIYKGVDPRAIVLRDMLKRRTLSTQSEWLVDVTDAVAREGAVLLSEWKGVQAYPNVDLYNAAAYSTFGFSPELNTSLFAVSRAAGWMAHILEHNKLQ
ncbi:MAG: citrate/2-methylcitrate synthase [Candidatus Thorarchaeota archaeon]|nr:citrate/2-methylcitrate synthase [Candidatus Thorarchaeota archaeon]